jgi:hypothetical protein
MIDDMTLRNLSPATQRSYLHAVTKFSRYFDCSPDRLGLEDGLAGQLQRIRGGDCQGWWRPTLRTVFLDTRSSRQICLIDFPWMKCARLIFAIVSTTNIPNSLPQIRRGSF